VGQFEAAFAAYLGLPFAVGVGSGTDAIALALTACGVGPGDEVVTAANSFAATAEAIQLCGATPVFADVDDDTLCLCPRALGRAITGRTRAVVPVHLHGLMADMEGICAVAGDAGLQVVEDAAQAHGARLADGKLAGSLAHAGCFSFFPGKNLGACGDGGAVVTGDEQLAARVAVLRDHGRQAGQGHVRSGCCSRLDTLQAAILSVKLPHLDSWNQQRQRLAGRYDQLLAGLDGLRLHPHPAGSVLHHYVVRTARREELQAALRQQGVACGAHYPRSIPEEPAFRALRTAPTPVADRSCQEVLSLPLFPELTDPEQDRVVAAVKGFFGEGA
jgi:dTDP-4-amino-4,6-dideoxygalactose transaminase